MCAAHERHWEPPDGGLLPQQRQLVGQSILHFLMTDVLADHGLVSTDGRYASVKTDSEHQHAT